MAGDRDHGGAIQAVAFIGFGEAAGALVEGWRGALEAMPAVLAYDVKTDDPHPAVRDAKRADYVSAGVAGQESLAEALTGRAVVFSTVTADQALAAATSAGGHLTAGALYIDCNSCAPDTKRAAARQIEAGGGRYIDAAVMAPVHPRRHRTPILLSGPHAEAGLEILRRLDMAATPVAGEVGTASAIKMVRSIVVKGLEALTVECLLAARRAGVEDAVLESLEASHPGFGWQERAGYTLERVITHGRRRAAEMREVAATVEQLGLTPDMAAASARWQQRVGELGLAAEGDDFRRLADLLLAALGDREPVSGVRRAG